MKLRALATLLWFVAAWSGTGFVAAIFGLPSALAVVGGLAIAMFVWFDPSGRLWTASKAKRRVRPIEEVAAELDAQAARRTPEGVESRLR